MKFLFKAYLNTYGDTLNDNRENLLNNIKEPIVCETCLKEYAAFQNPDITLRDYIKVDVGFSRNGIQVWCQRHNKNVCHIDFESKRPLADFRSLEKK